MTTLERKLAYRFINSNLLFRAFTHKSYHNENKSISIGNNERLEFLGDAVLGLVLSDYLMRTFPQVAEGHLSKLRASLVNETSLARISSELGLDELIRLGKGETQSGGHQKPRLLASVLEAVFGAVFVDGGFDKSYEVIAGLFREEIENVDLDLQFQSDYKTRLQEMVQDRFKKTPSYDVVSEDGPDHDKCFIIQVKVEDDILAQGTGNSKKQAAQDAARLALEGF